ncbi:MAG TPA: hypothetical protein VKY74_15110, partial [Chloroflexia bacterium]|nr:hypothetical protein [Chloroflexia bacterium]
PPRPLPPAPAPVVIQPPDSAPPAPVLADWAQEPPAAVDPAPPAGEPPTPPAPYGRPAPADAVRPHAVGDVLAHRSVGRGVSDYSPQTLSGSPREEGVGGGYPGAPVQPPAYGVFDEAHMGPAAAPGRPAPAAARRSRLPLLLGALVVLALLGGIGVALSGGLGTLLVSTPPPTADRAATAAAAAAGAATATAGAASAATLTAIPAATAATAAGIYSDQITALVQQVRAGDNDVVNSLHQADDGMITPKDAIALFENYTHANTIYKGQTAQLTAPLLYEHHLGQVSDALAARADALAVAADYLQKLRDLNDAQKTAQDADTTYTAAATVYAQNNSTDNYATLLRAKQALDNAQGEVSRLRTYADQDHQKFDSSWQDYNSLLPMVPPPPP